MKSVSVTDTKNSLSVLLDDVRCGERLKYLERLLAWR